MRRALLLDAGRADLWFMHAQWSLDVSRSDVSFESVKSALDLRPWHLDALELLVELVRSKDKNPAVVAQAFDGLGATLGSHPEIHRDAIALVVPARHEQGIAVLAESSDPVARAATRHYLARHGDEAAGDAFLAGLDPREARLALILRYLATGNVSRAVELLAEQPVDEIPVAGLRRAVRRSWARQQYGRTARLADQYLRAVPGDGWATRLRRESEQALKKKQARKGEVSNYQLMKRGFPFGPRATATAYTPDERRAFYLLHNSLPYNSAGYATRSHGLLRALTENWSMAAVTRLGYPFDAPGHDELTEIPAREVIDGVDYLRLTTAPGRWLKNPITDYVRDYSAALEGLARDERPFVIHAASNHWNGLTAVETARRLGIPSVYEVRGLWEVTRASRNPEWHDSGMYRYIARMEADAAAKATRVIAITGGLKDELINRGVDEEKILLVPNGVDTERFLPVERDVQLARELGLESKTVIGYIGSLLDYEGLDLVIRAAAELDRTRDDFHVLIVGDGAEKETFEALADELGVLGRVVTFTGRVPHADVERYYSLVDIAPFPRLPLPVCELVSPLKPFEAMAMGKAVVASDVRALAEIVDDGKTGLLHRKGDHADLVRTLTTLLDDEDLRRGLGAAGRRWVEQERTWSALSGRVSAVYDEISRHEVRAEVSDASPAREGTPSGS
ncbi:glycosyltransferase [Isoptericola sp. NPDC057559]|uniref:glycosyltransferase n=1 Tax=Isoptericola sp. NPDC057559 TaxID=3346168 RepID=UPI0036AF7613